MSNHTFTPGTRVRVFPTGETATVAMRTARFDELPAGFVPILLDSAAHVSPCAADNLVILESPAVIEPAAPAESAPAVSINDVSDAQLEIEIANLQAELLHRKADALTLEVEKAVAALRNCRLEPRQMTASGLVRAADAAGVSGSAIWAAWSIVAGATK